MADVAADGVDVDVDAGCWCCSSVLGVLFTDSNFSVCCFCCCWRSLGVVAEVGVSAAAMPDASDWFFVLRGARCWAAAGFL